MFVLVPAKQLHRNGNNMPNFDTLIPAQRLSFQIAWESTLKCNLDCSYCGDGHDNKTEHPSFAQCLDTVDFIYNYVDIKMSARPENQRLANLNIQGGESIFHPKIVDILKYINDKKQNYNWYMGVAIITNAVIGPNLWHRVVEFIDYSTISYHPEATKKSKELVKNNILYLQEKQKAFQVSVMMHPKHWKDCLEFIEWCKNKNINYNARQIDHHWLDMRFNYNTEQAEYLTGRKISNKDKFTYALTKGLHLSKTGRSCCGGNTLCAGGCNTNYVEGNNFKNWYCSVADYFLYIRQVTGEVFTNKDCKMNYQGDIGPIGNLKDTKAIIKQASIREPIVCKKKSCWCGLCAPKASTKEAFNDAMKAVLTRSN